MAARQAWRYEPHLEYEVGRQKGREAYNGEWCMESTLAVMAWQARSVVRCCRALRAAALQSLAARLSTRKRGFTSFMPPIASMWASPREAMLPTSDAAVYQASSYML